jgi:hypothetical protein
VDRYLVSSRQGWSQSLKLERLQEYILAYPHHGMDKWLVLQSFYNGMTPTSRAHINAIAGGAFLNLTIANATMLAEKMVSNQGWSAERLQSQTKGMQTVKEADMLATKLDLLLKKMDEGSKHQVHAHTLHAKYAELVDTRGTTALKPVKTLPSSSTTTTSTVHKEARGRTSRAHHIKKVITTTPISIQTNPP